MRVGRDWLGLLAASLAFVPACSSEDSADGAGGTAAAPVAGSSSGGAFASGGTTGVGTAGSAGTAGSGPTCARETAPAQFVPLDLFVMLDSSTSMSASTAAAGSTKWSEVQSGLLAFTRDPETAGIGIGLGYFPSLIENVPDTCSSDAACGEGGPCVSKICLNALAETDILYSCATDADCELGTQTPPTCRTIGSCSTNPDAFCFTESPASCDGTCTQSGICTHFVSCDVSRYGTPAVPIAPASDVEPALSSSLRQRMPAGEAPTAPALSGALQQARTWAQAHPEHKVVTLLAMGGIPTECSADDVTTDAEAVEEIADIARAAARAGMRTFALGIFTAADLTAGARTDLNSIAAAGGTEQALLIDSSSGNASRDVWAALNQIRAAERSCEFQVPEADASGNDIDYGRLNLDFTSGSMTTRLLRVPNQAACDSTRGGWYYDVDPTAAEPKRIVACPTSCEALTGAPSGAVKLELGCENEASP